MKDKENQTEEMAKFNEGNLVKIKTTSRSKYKEAIGIFENYCKGSHLEICRVRLWRNKVIQICDYNLEKLYNIDFRMLPKDSVVLSREEMERLSSSHDIVFCDNKDCTDNLLCRCCEISECPKNIPEYNEKLSANKHKLELFQKLCKERERADSWEDKYKLLEEELKQVRKETAEKIFKDIKLFLSDETLEVITRYFKEILGVEIKE